MKKKSKWINFALAICCCGFTGCGKTAAALSEFKSYSHAAAKVSFENIGGYEGEVLDGTNSNQHAVENGMIISPYLTCKINGKDVTVYATRCTNGAHSFAFADVTGEDEINLEVELTLVKTRKSVVVLPESRNVKAELDGTKKKVTATISQTGSYSFAFDDKEDRAFTLIVKRDTSADFPEEYAVRYFEPGEYTAEQTTFTQENTVYYFQEGDYVIDSVSLPSNSILYCDRTYFKISSETPVPALRSANTENVKVIGRCIYDFSEIDMTTDQKGTFNFSYVKNFDFEGITCIDSCSWTFCFTNCENGNISNITGLGYRTFTDGIMVANSNHMRISDCFMRTGDDAFEVKSTGVGKAGDVVFEDCHAWNDKAVGFGVIYEMNYPVYNVKFKNCSVGFNMPVWDVTRAAASVCMCDYEQGLTNYDIFFDNFEIYYSKCPIISLCMHSGILDNVRFSNFNVKKNMTQYPVYIKYGSTYIDGNPTEKRVCEVKSVYFDNILIEGKPLTFGEIQNADYPLALYLDNVLYGEN